MTQIPFLVTLWYSFQNYFFDVPGGAHFTGLSNYKAVFTSAAFRGALVRSVVMTVTAVIVAMILGVAIRAAAGPQVPRPGRGPDADHHPVPGHAGGGGAGVGRADARPELRAAELAAAAVRRASRGLAVHPRAGSVIVVMIWQWTPFMTLIVLAGLQGQPPDTLEAAKVDGAGALATFRELTFPHLRPYIELGILLGSIYLVNVFDAVRLMTNGGPGTSTTNLPFYLYQQVNNAFDVGGAAAAGVVTVILTIIVATFALRMFARVFQFEEAGV